MTEMPSPEPDTRNISTISLLLLKYWPTISVAVSRVIPTPTPVIIKSKVMEKPIRSLSLDSNETLTL